MSSRQSGATSACRRPEGVSVVDGLFVVVPQHGAVAAAHQVAAPARALPAASQGACQQQHSTAAAQASVGVRADHQRAQQLQ